VACSSSGCCDALYKESSNDVAEKPSDYDWYATPLLALCLSHTPGAGPTLPATASRVGYPQWLRLLEYRCLSARTHASTRGSPVAGHWLLACCLSALCPAVPARARADRGTVLRAERL